MRKKDRKPDKNKQWSKRPMLLFYAIAIISVSALQALVYPKLQGPEEEVQVVGYGTFLDQLAEGKISQVHVADKKITYDLKVLSKKEGPKYEAARMEGLNLVDRLHRGKIEGSERIYPMEVSPVLEFIVSFVSTFVFFIAVAQLLMYMLNRRAGGGGIGPMSFDRSSAKIYDQSVEGMTLDNVAGQDEAKETLEEIVGFLHNSKKYAVIGAKLPKGALSVGPPGTGKTLIAQAVAGETKVPFFSIPGSEFVEMFVGLGASKVRNLFKQANEKAPCIVFIDEINTIGEKWDGADFSGNDEREQTLNQLLTEMDGFKGKSGAVILAVTNRPGSLDPALLRPGHFDRRTSVELPDLTSWEVILEVHARKIKKDVNIDYNAIARATTGASGADLASMVNEGALRAIRQGRSETAREDLKESAGVVLAGCGRRNMVISPKEKEVIACHEVGHALVAAMQSDSAPVHKVTIIPRTFRVLGYTMRVNEEEKFLMSQKEAYQRIVTLTGGRSAEELIFDTRTSGASNDVGQATKIVRAMITRFDMSDKFGMVAMESVTNQCLGGDTSLQVSPDTAHLIDQEMGELIAKAHSQAITILKENMEALHEISRYLLNKETITGEELIEILAGYK